MSKVKEQTLVWNGQKPWDGVGFPISNEMSVERMMAAADLDWDVVSAPLVYRDANGNEHVSNKDILYRDGHPENPFTEVPRDNWHVLQNAEMFKFFEPYIESGVLRFVSAGSLHYGKMVWALAEIGTGFEVFKEDHFKNNILFTLPHWYGKAIDVRQTPLRISCNNMISLALGRRYEHLTVRQDHRKQFDPEIVKTTLKLADEQFENLRQTALQLGRITFTEDDLMDYLREVFPKKAKEEEDSKELSYAAETILEVMDTQPGAEYAYGTWWQVVQAVTFYTNHVFGKSNEQRLYSVWYERNQRVAIQALNKALEYSQR